MRHNQSVEPGMQIRGTFYPSQGPRGAASIASVLPKLLALLVVVAVVRSVVRKAGGHGGSSRWSRRRDAMAALHRELHAQDASAQSGPPSA